MATTRAAASGASPPCDTIPAMPHMLIDLFLRGDRRASRNSCRGAFRLSCGFEVHELTEPELEHDQAPQTMSMVAGPCAVFLPEPVDGTGVEQPSRTEPTAHQEIVDHRCEWSTQPLTDWRLESLLAPVDD